MKKYFLGISITALAICMSVLAFAQDYNHDSNGRYEVIYNGQPDSPYIVLAFKGIYDESTYKTALGALPDSDVVYAAQRMSDSDGKVVFVNIFPKTYADATVVVSGKELETPVLMGYLKQNGSFDFASIDAIMQNTLFEPDGNQADDAFAIVQYVKHDSFGNFSYDKQEVSFSVSPEGKGVSFDSEQKEKLVVSNFAKDGQYIITLQSAGITDTIEVTVQRKNPRTVKIDVYASQTAQETSQTFRISGVDGVFGTLEVFPKSEDQFGKTLEDEYNYYVDTQAVSMPYTPTKAGSFVLSVQSKNNIECVKNVALVVTDRPDYSSDALALYEVVKQAQDYLYLVEDGKMFVSTKNGIDVYGEYKWTTKERFDALEAQVDNANSVLAKYGSAELTTLEINKAKDSMQTQLDLFTSSLKDGTRVDAQSVTLSQESVTIAYGKSVVLTAQMYPEKNTDFITWSSSDEEVVTVSQTGKVVGVGAGKANVYATTKTGTKATCEVFVFVPVTRLSVYPTKCYTFVGAQPFKLQTSVLPERHSDTITWSSSNEDVATVDENGVVAVRGVGSAKITVRSGSGKSSTSTIKVGLSADKVVFKQLKTYSLAVDKTLTLSASACREDGEKPINDNVIYEIIEGKNIATIDEDGKLKGFGVGTVVVRATAEATLNGAYDEVEINVCIPATKVLIDKSKLSMAVGQESVKLQVRMSPENNTDTLTWQSSNTNVATVDEYGNVTAVGAGKANITAKSGSGKSAKCAVTVGLAADAVEIKELKSTSLAVGKTLTISAKAYCENGDKPISSAVVYEIVEGKEYAEIDAKGKLKGLAVGTVVVRATAEATLNGAYDEVEINVCIPATKVEFSQSEITVKMGEAILPEVNFYPDNMTDTFTFESSNEDAVRAEGDELVAVSGGEATITIKTGSGKTDKLKVFVEDDYRIVISSESLETDDGDFVNKYVVYNPFKANTQEVYGTLVTSDESKLDESKAADFSVVTLEEGKLDDKNQTFDDTVDLLSDDGLVWIKDFDLAEKEILISPVGEEDDENVLGVSEFCPVTVVKLDGDRENAFDIGRFSLLEFLDLAVQTDENKCFDMVVNPSQPDGDEVARYARFLKALVWADDVGQVRFVVVIAHSGEKAEYLDEIAVENPNSQELLDNMTKALNQLSNIRMTDHKQKTVRKLITDSVKSALVDGENGYLLTKEYVKETYGGNIDTAKNIVLDEMTAGQASAFYSLIRNNVDKDVMDFLSDYFDFDTSGYV